MTTQLTDEKLSFLHSFVERNKDFRVNGFGKKYKPKVHLGAKKIWFDSENPISLNIYNDGNQLYSALFDQLDRAATEESIKAIADKQKLGDKTLDRLRKFWKKRPLGFIAYQSPLEIEEEFYVKFDASDQMYFESRLGWVAPSDDRYDVLMKKAIDFFDKFSPDDPEEDETKLAIAEKLVSDNLPVKEIDSIPQELFLEDRVCKLEQAIAEINQQLEHCYRPTISDLKTEVEQLRNTVKRICINNIEKAVETEDNRLFSSIIILHFSRNGIQYQAKWDENDPSVHNTFVLTTRLTPSDPEDFMYQVEYDHTVGFVEVPKNPLWSNDTFIAVAKIAINAFLDGMRSGSELF